MLKFKKSISVLLAVLMIIGVMSTSLSVFAAEKTVAVQELESRILGYGGALNTAEPDAEALSEYEAIAASFKGLSDEEKNTMDVTVFDLLLRKAYDRGIQLDKIANPKNSTSKNRKAGHIYAGEALGFPTYIEEGIALASALSAKTATTEDKAAAFAAASANARIYAGLWNATYSCFYYAVDSSYAFSGAKKLTDLWYKEINGANKFSKTQPTRVAQPKEADYELGNEDPEYIAAYEKYLQYTYDNAQYQTEKYIFEGAQQLEAYGKLVEIAPEYAPVYNAIKLAVDSIAAYSADKKDLTPCKNAVDAYNALDKLGRIMFDAYGVKPYAFAAITNTGTYTCKYFKPSELIEMHGDIVNNGQALAEYLTVLDSVEEPYGNDDIAAVKAAFEKVPDSLRLAPFFISQEDSAKYRAILSSVGPDKANENTVDLSVYKKTEVSYNFLMNRNKVEGLADKIADLFFGLVKSDLISDGKIDVKKVFTNQNVGAIIKWLYPLVGNLNSIVAYGPNDLAKKLPEEKYAKAAEILAAAATVDENGKVVKNLADWEKEIVFPDGAWGFEDGDKEGFLEALSASCRALSIVTVAVTLENSVSKVNGTYTYGAYEDLIPILEMLDLEDIVSSAEYTEAVAAAEDSNAKMDARISLILRPIVNLVEKACNDPVNTLFDVLPKAAYLVDSGLLDSQLHIFTSKVGVVKIGEYSLTTEGLYGKVGEKLENLEVKGIKLNLVNKESFMKLIKDISGCGTAVSANSAARGNAYRLAVSSSKSDTFTVIYNYLRSYLSAEENMKTVETLLGTLGLNKLVVQIGMFAVKFIAKAPSGISMFFLNLFFPLIKNFIK